MKKTFNKFMDLSIIQTFLIILLLVSASYLAIIFGVNTLPFKNTILYFIFISAIGCVIGCVCYFFIKNDPYYIVKK